MSKKNNEGFKYLLKIWRNSKIYNALLADLPSSPTDRSLKFQVITWSYDKELKDLYRHKVRQL